MKILQLGKFYPIRGGVEKVMWDLSRGLNARGVHCDMLCAMLPSDSFDECDIPRAQVRGSLRTISFPGSGVCHCVKAYRKIAATMISPAMICWLRRHKDEYDIIHVHHPDPMACLALGLSGFCGKVILHWHSDILKQKGLLKLYLPLQKWLCRRADVIVCTTPAYLHGSPALAPYLSKSACLPIGIKDNIRTEETPDSGIRTVFSIGRLVEYKGFRYLVEAAEYLPENYRIVIGGNGPLREELQNQIAAYKLESRVVLAGYLSEEELRGWYNRCDVFVLPSIMKTEAFGIVQIEAMSCCKPVVATRIEGSGTAWVNEDGVSGLNVPIKDPKAIAGAILAICSDRDVYANFSACARKRYLDNFTLDKMVSGALDIYEKCML